MRVGIDARLLGVRRGIGNSLHALLIGLCEVPSEHTFFLYVDTADAAAMLPHGNRFVVRRLQRSSYPVAEHLLLPQMAIRDRVDVLHCPANTAPIFLPRAIKLVLTIHDVIFLQQQSGESRHSLFHLAQRLYYRTIVPIAAHRATRIITVSAFSKGDIAACIPKVAGKIDVVHNALATIESRNTEPEAQSQLSLGGMQPYFLALAAEDPRKNTYAVLRAFKRLMESGVTCFNLVLAGLQGRFRWRVRSLVDRLGIGGNVIEFGFVTVSQLSDLYRGAHAFVYPSLYEGFGVPIIEAMSRGTPVITSDVTAMPEIAGGAALLVNPLDSESIMRAMANLAVDPALVSQLRALGTRRAMHFSPERAAFETLQIYAKNS